MAIKNFYTGVYIGDNLGIGTTTPGAKLEVSGSAIIRKSGAAIAHTDTDLLVTDATAGGSTAQIQILSGNAASSMLYFSDTDSYSQGGIQYLHYLDSMNFRVNASTAMSINSSRNVGIGTTSPTQKLDVAGSIRTNANLYVYNSDLSRQALRVNAEATTNTGILKLSNGSNWGLLMRGESNSPYIGSYFNGNLSITGFEDSTGTTTSAIKLAQFVFGGTGGGSGYLNLNGDLRVNTNKKIKFQYANSQENGIEWIAGSKISAAITPVDTANFSRAGLGFFTGDFSDGTTNADERMRITRAGNVGIGTTSPSEKLEVSGNIKLTSSSNAIRDFNGNTLLRNTSGTLTVGNAALNIGSVYTVGAAATQSFKRSSTTDLFINSSGNVGIGTTSPWERLSIPFDRRLSFGSANYPLSISRASAGQLITTISDGYDNANTRIDFKMRAGSANENIPLSITSSGNVGIGTTSPGAALEVVGGIKLSDNSPLTWATSNTRIFGQSGYMQLQVASSDVMRLTSAGDVGIGVTAPRAKLDVAGGVKVADDTDTASANKVGTLRYRYVPGSPKNFSYVDMCMQTGASSYAWVNIVQNVWN